MQLNVSVTQSHIARGQRRNAIDCPVALAIKEQLNEDVRVNVSTEFIIITRPDADDSVYVHTPEPVAQAVHAIDSGWAKYVKPFKFTFTIAD